MLFLAIAFGFFYGIEKTKNSGWGVALLLGFTFFMGLMLSRLLGVVLGMRNGGSSSRSPSAAPAVIFATMATLATTIKRDLSGDGQVPVRRRDHAAGGGASRTSSCSSRR